MVIKKTDDFIKIEFPNSVTSANATDISDEIFSIVDENVAGNIVVDLSNTQYISSAGLRVLLRLQKSKSNLTITNVTLEVYEIFEMTGFTSIMNIEKQRRKISLEGATLIGKGYTADVYRISDDTIVKVFVRNPSIDNIKRELNLAKQAFVLGVPTAISYDVVEVGDKFGVVFELINSGLLRDALINEPDKFDLYMKRYADVLLTMNTTDIGNTDLPNVKDEYLKRINILKDRVSADDYIAINDFVKAIPDSHTFVHGDCHIKNIMYSGSELLLIDMDTLSYGNPMFELAQLYSPYMLFPQVYENNTEEFFGISEQLAKNITKSVFDYYFADTPADEKATTISNIITLAHIHIMLFFAIFESNDIESFNKTYALYKNNIKSNN